MRIFKSRSLSASGYTAKIKFGSKVKKVLDVAHEYKAHTH